MVRFDKSDWDKNLGCLPLLLLNLDGKGIGYLVNQTKNKIGYFLCLLCFPSAGYQRFPGQLPVCCFLTQSN